MPDILEILDGYDEPAVCEILNVRLQTLRNWRCAGTGPPYFRAGNRFIYPKAGFREWTEARTVYPSPQQVPFTMEPRRRGRPRKSQVAA